MLKLYEEQTQTINELQKAIGCKGHYTLYKFAKKQADINNMSSKILLKLSNYLGMNPQELHKKMEEYLNADI